jgi:MFS family permease
VAALFLINAVGYASVVPRLPAIKDHLDLSNTALGTAIAALPLGALLSGTAAGAVIGRVGSGRTATVCGLGVGLFLPLVALAPSWWALASVFFLLGALDSVMDVSMNAHGLRVQRLYGRSIIKSFHAIWSSGAVAGGLTGAAAAGRAVPLSIHLTLVAAVIVSAALWASKRLLPGPEDAERPADRAAQGGSLLTPTADRPLVHPAVPVLVALGLLLMLTAIIEDAPASWGALLLRGVGAGATASGLAYTGFQAAMTLGRVAGDRVVDRWGEVTVVLTGGLLVALAVGGGLVVERPWALICGFALAGFGAAPLFPVAFHAAGNLPGLATGNGVAIVSWLARVGFLVAPPLIGALADRAGLRMGLVVVPMAGLGVAGLAGVLRSAGFGSGVSGRGDG